MTGRFRHAAFGGLLVLALAAVGAAQDVDQMAQKVQQEVDREVARLQSRGATRVKVTYIVEFAEMYSDWKEEVWSLDGGYDTLAEAARAARRIKASDPRHVTKVTITPQYSVTWPPPRERPQEPTTTNSYYVPPGGKIEFDDNAPKQGQRVRPEAPKEGGGPAGAPAAGAKKAVVYDDAAGKAAAVGTKEVVSLRKQPPNPRPVADGVIVVWEKKNGKDVYVGTYPPGKAERVLKELKARDPNGQFMRDPKSRSEAGQYVAQKFRKIEFVRPDWVDPGASANSGGTSGAGGDALAGRTGRGTLSGNGLTLRFGPGGTVSGEREGEGRSFTGTYTVRGDEVTLVLGPSTFRGRLSGNTISGSRARSDGVNDTWEVTLGGSANTGTANAGSANTSPGNTTSPKGPFMAYTIAYGDKRLAGPFTELEEAKTWVRDGWAVWKNGATGVTETGVQDASGRVIFKLP
jgi:hypothetical protein